MNDDEQNPYTNYEPLEEEPDPVSINRRQSGQSGHSSEGPDRTTPFLQVHKVRPSRSFQIDQDALTKYKRQLQKRVAWAFILLFIVIIERIFAGYTRDDEDNAIASLQQSAGITYSSSKWYLQPVVFLENSLFFVMVLSHFYVIMYYFYDAIICLKVMYVHLNAIGLIAFLEILFGDPRPYWDDSLIAGAGCQNSYGFPSFTIFSLLFLFMYTWHCSREDEDDHEDRLWTKMDIIKCAIFVVIFGSYCFMKILAGYDYISQVCLSILYAILIYYLAIFFDKTLTNLVEKSSIDVQNAKRYIIFWMVYIIVFASVQVITYETSNTFLEIDWFQNYYTCLKNYGDTSALDNTPYYQLLGGWGSFLKTLVIFILLGSIFGAAKAFRDFKGVLWYATTTRNKVKMTITASLCLAPSWVLIGFESQFIQVLQSGGIDAFLFNAIHFSLLYFALFGLLPKYLFDRYGWLNKESGYYFVEDEMVKIDHSNDASSSIQE